MDAKVEEQQSRIQDLLEQTFERHRGNSSGQLADYIPQLAAVDPEKFGIAVATADGALYTIGDTDHPFTIQSVSKAFMYCLALELGGRDEVLGRVGVEPSGDAFNSIFFDPLTNRAYNPMVNAGAITVAGVVYEFAG